MTFSLRLNNAESALIKNYAEMNHITVSDLFRSSVLERIEEEYDLKAFDTAYAAYQEDPVTYTLGEVEKELGLA